MLLRSTVNKNAVTRASWAEVSVATPQCSDAGVAGEFDAVSCAVRFGPASGVFRVHTTSRLKFANYNFELAALRKALGQCAAENLIPGTRMTG